MQTGTEITEYIRIRITYYRLIFLIDNPVSHQICKVHVTSPENVPVGTPVPQACKRGIFRSREDSLCLVTVKQSHRTTDLRHDLSAVQGSINRFVSVRKSCHLVLIMPQSRRYFP